MNTAKLCSIVGSNLHSHEMSIVAARVLLDFMLINLRLSEQKRGQGRPKPSISSDELIKAMGTIARLVDEAPLDKPSEDHALECLREASIQSQKILEALPASEREGPLNASR